MTTASISGSAKRSAASAVTFSTPSSAASFVAASTAGSAIAASVAPGIHCARLRAWNAPIQPAPMSPMRTGGVRDESTVW